MRIYYTHKNARILQVVPSGTAIRPVPPSLECMDGKLSREMR